MTQTSDHWSTAEIYEQFMGRWSRELAHPFVHWVGSAPGLHWLDLGCGTGALASAICTDADPASVLACDPSESFIDYARSRSRDARVSYAVAGADDFPVRPGGYDTIASLLALNFFPDPVRAVLRMKAALSGGGVVAACVWDYGMGMQCLRVFWDAAKAISSHAASFDEAARFPTCDPARLQELFSSAGLADVQCGALDIPTRFRNFEDYWMPLLGGTGPAPSFVAGLDSAARNQLRSELESRLPVGANGAIELTARAWTISGHSAQAS